MSTRYAVEVLRARAMAPIGDYRWFAQVRVKQLETGRDGEYIRLPGEWHGKTREEAESKARRAAEDWIASHTE